MRHLFVMSIFIVLAMLAMLIAIVLFVILLLLAFTASICLHWHHPGVDANPWLACIASPMAYTLLMLLTLGISFAMIFTA